MKNKRRIAVALVVCLLWVMVVSPLASADMIITPMASTLIQFTAIGIYSSGNTVSATAIIQCIRAVNSLGFNYIRIQEYRDNSWVTVKSTQSEYKNNSAVHTYTISYNGTPGRIYRAQAGYVAQDGITTETRSKTSSEHIL